MRRILPPVAILVALLASAASALGAGGAGYNGPSRALEAAFKVALYDRAGAPDGCYPPAEKLVPRIHEVDHVKAGVANSFGSIHRRGVIYVVKKGASCDRLLMALLTKQGLYTLDSVTGKVDPPPGVRKKAGQALGLSNSLGKVRLVTKSFRMTRPDQLERFAVNCPPRSFPLGGGMTGSPAPSADGEGAYPHSYERLGVQRGWHVSAALADPSHESTTPRRVTLQAVCSQWQVAMTAPHKTIFLKSGQSGTATVRCPGNQVMFSGGFQRTDFFSVGGDYVTESRAVGANGWTVSGHAFGAFGGELSAIAYCVSRGHPLLTEVSGSTPIPAAQSATATTPRCPKGRRLTLGGFSLNGSEQSVLTDGRFNKNGTWAASGFGYFGASPKFTAYGYCLRL